MSDPDELERHLRRTAHESLDRDAAAVDVDAELAHLGDRLAGRTAIAAGPRGGHGRSGSPARWLAAAAAAILVIGGIVAIAWPRGDGADPVAPPPPTTAPNPPTTTSAPAVVPPVTDDDESDDSEEDDRTPTTLAPDEATADPAAICLSEPFTPPSLVDGSPPGEVTIEDWGDSRGARWGEPDTLNVVYQLLDDESDESLLDLAIDDDRSVTSAAFEAAAIPVGDPPISSIMIVVRDTGDGCVRTYSVGPGLFLDEANDVAQHWVDQWAAGTTATPPTPAGLEMSYFGPRDTFDDLEIDQFDPHVTEVTTLTAAEVAILFGPHALPDGSSVARFSKPQGRCVNHPLDRSHDDGSGPLHADLAEARSIAVGRNGTVIATRDVCPEGTRWGDPGTRWELVSLDTSEPAPEVEVLTTQDADPDRVAFDDGEIVITLGELAIEAISPDGRYVSLLDPFNPDGARWHMLDIDAPGGFLELPTTCDVPGDIIGQPRFVADIAVIARLCAESPVVDPAPQLPIGSGTVRVEAVDLTATSPGEAVVWHAATDVPPNGHTREARVSAAVDDAGALWVLLRGYGDVEQSTRSFALSGERMIEITRPGYDAFAFDPAELIRH